ncbi:MAG: hypothetical protein WAV31_04525 [Candidatus Moraniibacteriota bacterium]
MTKITKVDENEFVGYLKFFGPSVDDGKIDIEKIGNSLIALNKIYRKYSKQQKQNDLFLKLGKVQRNCTEVNVYLQQIATIAQPVVQTATWALIAKSSGIAEFGKQFFGTVGQQLALKIFSKGKNLEKKKEFAEDGNIFVLARNMDGDEKIFLKEMYDTQKDYVCLSELVQLEKEKEEKMKIGYYHNSKPKDVGEVKLSEKEFFKSTESNINFEEKLDEEFDETKAEEIKIVGKFVDYYGLAHKYNFSFQARKDQDEIGKQKILCKTDNLNISEIIELLKPEKQEKNVCIFGKATKNNDDKIDKIKIEWINEDENYNPNQKKLI